MFIDVGSASLFFDVVGESLNASTPDMSQRPTMILLHGGPGYDHSTLRPYFDRYSDDAIFLGTDKTERWTIEEFKAYAKPAFADGHGWTYTLVERSWEGSGNIRWFDETLFNKKLGHCRGTGVVQLINGEWKIAHYSLTMLVPNAIAEDVGSQTREVDKQ